MKPLNRDELFNNLKGFLKQRGVELQEGSYARGIQKSCSLLSDAINLGQQGLDKAKVGIDKKLDQMRQVIHEKTAPRASASASPKASGATNREPRKAAQTKTRPRRKTKSAK